MLAPFAGAPPSARAAIGRLGSKGGSDATYDFRNTTATGMDSPSLEQLFRDVMKPLKQAADGG